MLHIVLLEPEIPQNTGNISRTCAVTGCDLHLIGPLGFTISDRTLKRAGLDYWDQLQVYQYDGLAQFRQAHPEARPWMASAKAANSYCAVTYQDGDWLMFGKETKGLPEALLRADPQRTIRIPMLPGARCLNLSNAVAVVTYEALRQQGFSGLREAGRLSE